MADSNIIQLAQAKLIWQESYFYTIIIQSRSNKAGCCLQKYNNYRVTCRTKAYIYINGFYGGAYTKYVQQLYSNRYSYYNSNQLFNLKDKNNKLYDLNNNNKEDNSNNTCNNASIKIEDLVINPWHNTQVIKQGKNYIEALFHLVRAPLGSRFL